MLGKDFVSERQIGKLLQRKKAEEPFTLVILAESKGEKAPL